ncbi:hypothetical protein STEG23_009420 [Scotinomys teguina]
MPVYCSEETTKKNKEEVVEYAKLLAKIMMEAKEKRQEQIAETLLRASTSKSGSSQKRVFKELKIMYFGEHQPKDSAIIPNQCFISSEEEISADIKPGTSVADIPHLLSMYPILLSMYPILLSMYPILLSMYPILLSTYPILLSMYPILLSMYPILLSMYPVLLSMYPILLSMYPVLLSTYPVLLSMYPILLSMYPILLSMYPVLLSMYPILLSFSFMAAFYLSFHVSKYHLPSPNNGTCGVCFVC